MTAKELDVEGHKAGTDHCSGRRPPTHEWADCPRSRSVDGDGALMPVESRWDVVVRVGGREFGPYTTHAADPWKARTGAMFQYLQDPAHVPLCG